MLDMAFFATDVIITYSCGKIMEITDNLKNEKQTLKHVTCTSARNFISSVISPPFIPSPFLSF